MGAIANKTDIRLGCVMTHVKFTNLVPDENGCLPRDGNGEFFPIANLRKLQSETPLKISIAQTLYFAGTKAEDIDELLAKFADLGVEAHLILMMGGADPMNPDDEDAVVAMLMDGVNVAKRNNLKQVGSTSIEEWMKEGATRKEGAEFEAAVEQVSKVHARLYREADLASSSLDVWNIEFLRTIEFQTFTDLGRLRRVIQRTNAMIGTTFFKVLLDAAHCGDSTLKMHEHEELIKALSDADELGVFHASTKTTRGCLSSDDGWIANILWQAAAGGKLKDVIVEVFCHDDPILAPLRDAVEGHGVDTTDGRTYDEVVLDGFADVSRRLNNLKARGLLS